MPHKLLGPYLVIRTFVGFVGTPPPYFLGFIFLEQAYKNRVGGYLHNLRKVWSQVRLRNTWIDLVNIGLSAASIRKVFAQPVVFN